MKWSSCEIVIQKLALWMLLRPATLHFIISFTVHPRSKENHQSSIKFPPSFSLITSTIDLQNLTSLKAYFETGIYIKTKVDPIPIPMPTISLYVDFKTVEQGEKRKKRCLTSTVWLILEKGNNFICIWYLMWNIWMYWVLKKLKIKPWKKWSLFWKTEKRIAVENTTQHFTDKRLCMWMSAFSGINSLAYSVSKQSISQAKHLSFSFSLFLQLLKPFVVACKYHHHVLNLRLPPHNPCQVNPPQVSSQTTICRLNRFSLFQIQWLHIYNKFLFFRFHLLFLLLSVLSFCCL